MMNSYGMGRKAAAMDRRDARKAEGAAKVKGKPAATGLANAMTKANPNAAAGMARASAVGNRAAEGMAKAKPAAAAQGLAKAAEKRPAFAKGGVAKKPKPVKAGASYKG
jgi:hypothetical protein